MSSVVENFQMAFGVVTHSDEIEEIKLIADELIELRKIRHTAEAKEKAKELDQRINNLNLVKNNCETKISSLELVSQRNPYEKIQDKCPVLKNVSMSEAMNLWSRFS